MRLSPAGSIALALAGCGGGDAGWKQYRTETFEESTAYNKQLAFPSSLACRAVKQALLSQGYMIDRSSESIILVGSKNWQVEDETTVTLNLQVTCVHNDDESSTVFAAAVQELSRVQRVTGSMSAGVSIATVTVPQSSGRQLVVVGRDTIRDPEFYGRFYALVQRFAENERKASTLQDAKEKGSSAR